ncbi:MAG: DUF3833 domain-containing protein [Burkholderiaceae bacterium]|nr:DUF3833 domain-containing protein [Burkholderiaceae bacterium]
MRKSFLALLLPLVLAGCAAVDPTAYADQTPALDLRRYFEGALEGHGLVTDRAGRAQRRFVVTIRASWTGDVGSLDEDFVWSDGERERRVWTLRPAGTQGREQRWIGTAADVIGEARGSVAGNALNWRYTFDLKTKDGRRYALEFDDWMYLVDERVMLNRATISFYGFRVGEVLIAFRRL